GDFAVADSALRENARVGVLLLEDGPDFADAAQGTGLLRNALEALVTLDSVRGDRDGAAQLRSSLDAVQRLRESANRDAGSATVARAEATLADVSRSPDIPVGYKWTQLRLVVLSRAMRYCLGPIRLRDWHAWQDSLRPLFARTASEARFFAWVADPPSPAACVRTLAGPRRLGSPAAPVRA